MIACNMQSAYFMRIDLCVTVARNEAFNKESKSNATETATQHVKHGHFSFKAKHFVQTTQ